MVYNTNLQSNNAELQKILNTINSLPEAGSGGESSDDDVCYFVMTNGITIEFIPFKKGMTWEDFANSNFNSFFIDKHGFGYQKITGYDIDPMVCTTEPIVLTYMPHVYDSNIGGYHIYRLLIRDPDGNFPKWEDQIQSVNNETLEPLYYIDDVMLWQ